MSPLDWFDEAEGKPTINLRNTLWLGDQLPGYDNPRLPSQARRPTPDFDKFPGDMFPGS